MNPIIKYMHKTTMTSSLRFLLFSALGLMLSVAVLSNVVLAETLQLQTADGKTARIATISLPIDENKTQEFAALTDIAEVLSADMSFDPITKYVEIGNQTRAVRLLIGSRGFLVVRSGQTALAGSLTDPVLLHSGSLFLTPRSARELVLRFGEDKEVKTAAVEPKTSTTEPRQPSRPQTSPPQTEKTSEPKRSEVLSQPVQYPAPQTRKNPSFIKNIVIDAGHGAHDAGAVGPGGTKEKDVNLAVALELARLLSSRTSADVTLTRHDDTFLSLQERVAVSKRQDADLFISIHSNSAGGSSASRATGTEVYFFSKPTSQDEIKAERIHGGPFDPQAIGIDPVLWNLMLAGNVIESHKLADVVQRRLPGLLGLPSRGVKSARFYVLYNGVLANYPAILIELGFLSNPDEERKLADANWQKKAAKGISDSIMAYLDDLEARYPGGRGWK